MWVEGLWFRARGFGAEGRSPNYLTMIENQPERHTEHDVEGRSYNVIYIYVDVYIYICGTTYHYSGVRFFYSHGIGPRVDGNPFLASILENSKDPV